MASPDYIDVVGGVFGRSYEDVTFFLHFLAGRILACAFRVARVEATTMRVAPATSDVPFTAIYCSSVARARIYEFTNASRTATASSPWGAVS